MKNLRYMCAQPANDYYTWQVEVVIHNFIKHGINPNNLDIVCSIPEGSSIPENWITLANTYNYVRFFFYEDTRKNSPYISSIRPNILKKHFKKYPSLKDEIIFYFDCDMIFTRPPDWSKFVNDDIWYCSDTRFYIGAEYIKSKGFGIYEKMCEIVKIPENIPQENELNSGGAQYMMKNIDHVYWEKVEHDSDALYQYFLDHLVEHPETPEYHAIQKWTADMWAVLWNAWYFGHEVRTPPELEFSWGTCGVDNWQKNTIYHNAGVLDAEKEKYFYKGQYNNKIPYNITNHVDPALASHNYVKEILETAKKTCL